MADVTGICNRALQKLGAARIASITENSVNARACAACYEIIRDAELEDHNWNFAIKRVQLAASATAPVFDKQNAFPLPADFVRLVPPDPDMNFNNRDWQIENGAILTNDSAPLDLRYVSRVTDTTLMPALFCETVSSKMAEQMAEQLTQSNQKKKDAAEDYDRTVARAKKSNAIQNVPQDAPEDIFITARG